MSWEHLLPEADYQLYRRNISLLEARIVERYPDAGASAAVLSAVRAVPRHLFVPRSYRCLAYTDNALPTSGGLTTSAPSVIAQMIEQADVRPGHRVLEIGTGTGYQAAVLAEMGARVFSIEVDGRLAHQAARLLQELGYKAGTRVGETRFPRRGQVRLFRGNGRDGLPQYGPYQAIIVSASVPHLRTVAPLAAQLSPRGGTLVVPVGSLHDQVLHIVQRHDRRTAVSVLRGVSFDFVRLA